MERIEFIEEIFKAIEVIAEISFKNDISYKAHNKRLCRGEYFGKAVENMFDAAKDSLYLLIDEDEFKNLDGENLKRFKRINMKLLKNK